MTTTNPQRLENMAKETKHGTTKSKAVDQQQACSALLNDFHRKWYGRQGTIKDGHLKVGNRVICTGVCDNGADRELMGYEGALPTGQIFVRVDGMDGEQCVLPMHVEWEPNADFRQPETKD
jgi:hypothetical protein